MRTQSSDTSIEAEQVLVGLIRKAPISKRFQLVQAMTQGTFLANIAAWKESHPEASEQEAGVHFVSISYGTQLAQQAQADLEQCKTWHLQPVDLLAILHDIAQIFDAFTIPWYLGGSLASSLYGMQQLAQDIDIVIDIPFQHLQHLPLFISSLKQHYIFDESALHKVQDQRTSFSLLHRDSLMKVDMIVTPKRVFDAFRLPHATGQTLPTRDERYRDICVASPSEMILFKLYRYNQTIGSRQDSMIDDAEWNDILGMLKVQGPLLDLSFLERWVQRLGIEQTWRSVLLDAGVRDSIRIAGGDSLHGPTRQRCTLPTYSIAQTPITVGQWRKYLGTDGSGVVIDATLAKLLPMTNLS